MALIDFAIGALLGLMVALAVQRNWLPLLCMVVGILIMLLVRQLP